MVVKLAANKIMCSYQRHNSVIFASIDNPFAGDPNDPRRLQQFQLQINLTQRNCTIIKQNCSFFREFFTFSKS